MSGLFRRLRADEIDVRLGTVDRYGFSLLLYKDARCDQRVLDETFTPWGWQKETRKEGETFISRVLIQGPDGDWIYKEGAGSAGNFEPEKSAESDSFKRACFAWGLGRDLYTAPRIHLNAKTYQEGRRYFLENSSDAYGWRVHRIEYDDAGISALELEKDGTVHFRWAKDPTEATRADTITAKQAETLEKIIPPDELEAVLAGYGVRRAIELTNAQHAEIVRAANE